MPDLPEALMLTTVDNPYSPFDEFPMWLQYDTAKGYNSLAILGRILVINSEMSEGDRIVAQNQAVNEIVELNVTGMFRRVSESGLIDR